MILKDEDVQIRLESPLNLINQLNSLVPKTNGMNVFLPAANSNQEQGIADAEEIIDEDKLRLGLVKSQALSVLHDSLTLLHGKLPDVRKPRDLSRISRDMKSILSEDKGTVHSNSQVVIYKPIINDISKYDTLVVVE